MNTSATVSRNTRRLTDLERGYAQSKLRLARFGKWMGVAGGAAVIVVGIVFLVTTFEEGGQGTLIGVVMFFVAVPAGVLLLSLMLPRRYTLDDMACKVAGILLLDTFGMTHPGTGARAQQLRYRLGDVTMLWPQGAESLCRPWVGKHVEVVGVMLKKSNPIKPFDGTTRFDEGPEDLIVLEFQHTIRIHAVLQRYGRHYFRRRAALIGAGSLSALLLMVAGALYVMRNPAVLHAWDPGLWWGVGVIVLALIGLSLALAMAQVLFTWLVRLWKPDFNSTTHAERLKG